MAMEDNESCNSRTIDSSSPTNPRQQRQKLEVYNEVLRRLKQDSDIQEANLPGFDDELWAHFNRLPARYALDVNVERAQDVLTHKRLLQLAHDPANRPAFEVRLVQLSPVSDGHCNDSVHSNSPSKEDAQSSHIPIRQSIHSAPAPAFGSPRNLEVLALAADDSQDQDGESTVNAKPCFAGSRHEITISTDDKPKLLSQLTALLAEIGLDIEEAHAFSTVDGYSLDVFVVNGWAYEETEQLRHVLETEIWKIEIPDEVSPFICSYLPGIANNVGMLYMSIMKMLKAILRFPSMGNNFPIDDIIVITELAQFGIFSASNKQSWLKPHPLSNDDNEQTGVEPILNHVKIPSDGIDVWEIDARLLKFETKVGSGSFGDLYKGTFHSQEVAIKVLKPERVNEAMQQEFAQEVYIMRKVRHRNVVQFIGACTRPPRLCIVTEFMSGGSVYDFLHKQKGIFKLPSLLRVAIDVSKGMNYLHQNNIVHRDLKAANLLMDENEVVKVADFGVARVQTQSGVMTAETGTYRWMAPEVIEHKPYDHKADIFSFGIVLWELLTAKVPYEYMTPLQAAVGVVQKGLRPTIPKNTHPKLVELLESCWQQDPALRPEFSEIIEILQQTAKEVRNQGEGGHREKSTSGFLSVLNRGHQ